VTDAQSQQNLEKMLEQSVGSSTPVNARGVHSEDTHLTSIPEGLDRGETCEVIPGHSLKPFNNGKSYNGIRIFASRKASDSEEFLKQNHDAIDNFARVLVGLCSVYGLNTSSIAIFHDPSGRTIAFNQNRAVHCNLRFFYALHYLQNKGSSADCYSYWFVTIAHELAHNFVSAHNKEHGFYTESYVTHYLPKLMELLTKL